MAEQRNESSAACASDPIRNLRYVVAELRTRGEVGLADILEQAVSKIFVGVEPAGTRGAATSPDEPGYVAPSGFSPGGCAAPAHSSKLGPDRRDRGARFVPGASASSASDKTPNTGSSGPSSAAYTLRESQALHEVGVAHHGWYMTEAEHRGVLGVLNDLGAILDDLCDWAQHVGAPENDGIHSIVERAEAMLKGERNV